MLQGIKPSLNEGDEFIAALNPKYRLRGLYIRDHDAESFLAVVVDNCRDPDYFSNRARERQIFFKEVEEVTGRRFLKIVRARGWEKVR